MSLSFEDYPRGLKNLCVFCPFNSWRGSGATWRRNCGWRLSGRRVLTWAAWRRSGSCCWSDRSSTQTTVSSQKSWMSPSACSQRSTLSELNYKLHPSKSLNRVWIKKLEKLRALNRSSDDDENLESGSSLMQSERKVKPSFSENKRKENQILIG